MLPPWTAGATGGGTPRARQRALVKPFATFAEESLSRREAMARAFLTDVYTMQEIADCFGVHYSTVSRAVRRLESADDPQVASSAKLLKRDCRT